MADQQQITVAPAHREIYAILQARDTALKNFLGDERNALRFISSAMQCIQANPKLLECSRDSLIGAFMECAAVQLFPSNWSGECYVLPYDSAKGMVAQFQMGYKGFLTLGYRNGVDSIWAEIVYANDKFKETKGTDPKIEHEAPFSGDRGEAIGAYACAKFNGQVTFLTMNKEQVMAIKETSKAKASKYSPWNSNDPERWMWKKTVIKQLAKFFPKGNAADQMSRAIQLDNINERGGYIAAEGQVVEAPFSEEEKVDSVKEKKEALKKKKEAPAPAMDKTEGELLDVTEALKTMDAKHPDHAKLMKRKEELTIKLQATTAPNTEAK